MRHFNFQLPISDSHGTTSVRAAIVYMNHSNRQSAMKSPFVVGRPLRRHIGGGAVNVDYA